jgi:hypothetical protein
MLLGFFLTVENWSLDPFDLHNRTQAAWTKYNSLRMPVKAGRKGWHWRAADKKVLVSLDSPLFRHSLPYTEIHFSSQLPILHLESRSQNP